MQQWRNPTIPPPSSASQNSTAASPRKERAPSYVNAPDGGTEGSSSNKLSISARLISAPASSGPSSRIRTSAFVNVSMSAPPLRSSLCGGCPVAADDSDHAIAGAIRLLDQPGFAKIQPAGLRLGMEDQGVQDKQPGGIGHSLVGGQVLAILCVL